MYEAFYGLDLDPFRLSPDHRFCFPHGSYAKAKAYLEYGLQRAEGLVAVTGSPGTGKSTLVEDLLAGFGTSRIVVARLVSTQLRATDLLRMVAFEFTIKAEGMDKATLLRSVEGYTSAQAAAGRRVLVIVDEAQDLSTDALEELRLLTNMQYKGRPLMQVFLLGQDQLHAKMTSPAMEQLRQRVVAASRLKPMTAAETRAYMTHRLERAGWKGDPEITGEAIELIHRHSKGIPRLVNQTCSRLLLYGAAEQKHKLDGADARAVIQEFEEEMPPLHDVSASRTTAGQQSISRGPPSRAAALSSEPPLSLEKLPAREETAKDAIRLGPIAATTSVAAKSARSRARSLDTRLGAVGQRNAVKPPDSKPSAVKPQAKAKRGKYTAALVLVMCLLGAGALALASLESKPLGSTLANWSRNIASEMRGVFAAGRASAPAGDGAIAERALTAEDVSSLPAEVPSDSSDPGREEALSSSPARRH